MRLGGNEALIFTSGRPAIRARKLRYYNDPFFKRRATIPPSPSDRIALPSPTNAAAIAASIPFVDDPQGAPVCNALILSQATL